jgi:hypothetical protein
MPENGEDVNTDVAIRNNAQQRVITEVRGRTESGELGPIVRVGCFYSPNCLEEVLSEAGRIEGKQPQSKWKKQSALLRS